VNGFGEPSLDLIMELAQPSSHDAALDFACGAGKAAFALAGRVRSVEAVDEQPEALDEGRRLSAELGLRDLTFTLVDLYSLPYGDGTFSLVVCRSALHRLPEPVEALREMARVTSRGGRVVLYDAVVDEVCDHEFNELARLREPAHRRHYRTSEFGKLFKQAKLRVAAQRIGRRTVDLDYWLEANAVPPEKADLIRLRFQALPVDVQDHMDVAYSDKLVSFSYDALAVRLEP
jgi:ubiquinone/menaquinone biosynthesis C-methylase UbiE